MRESPARVASQVRLYPCDLRVTAEAVQLEKC